MDGRGEDETLEMAEGELPRRSLLPPRDLDFLLPRGVSLEKNEAALEDAEEEALPLLW